MKDTAQSFSKQTVVLHWIIAVGMIAMLSLGWYMAAYEAFSLYGIHKSIGVLLFVVILWRIWWRMQNGWPQPVREFAHAQLIAARASHWILITGTALMPVSGFLMSAFNGYGVAVFGLTLVPVNLDAAGEVIARNEAIAHFAHNVHYYASRIVMAVVAVHFLAALKHHFVDKDNVLRRMLSSSPRTR